VPDPEPDIIGDGSQATPSPAPPEQPADAPAAPQQQTAIAIIPEVLRPEHALSPSSLGDVLDKIPSVVDAAAMTLVRMNARALETDRTELKAENRQLQQEIRSIEKQLAALETANAVLEQQLQSLRQSDRLRGFLKTIGGLFVGTGLSMLVDHSIAGFGLAVVGVVLLNAGWMWPLDGGARS
jgi:FtsZ-binding cell division protein ZapB